jgi:hypothetical protein
MNAAELDAPLVNATSKPRVSRFQPWDGLSLEALLDVQDLRRVPEGDTEPEPEDDDE